MNIDKEKIMKNFKIILLAILFIGISKAVNAQQSKDFDLNIVTTQNDHVVGGDLIIKIQIRATATKGSFDPADFTLALAFSNEALSIDESVDYTWLGGFTNLFALKSVTRYDGGYGYDQIGWGQLGTTYPANPITIGTAWVDMIEFRFNIKSIERAQAFFSLGPGLAGANSFREVITTSQPTSMIYIGEGFTEVKYDGTNWIGGNGVSGAPNETDASKGIIVSAGTATLTGNVQCDYFRVSSGAKLVVGPNATLKPFLNLPVNPQNPNSNWTFDIPTSDEFVIDADATGYGQYIGPGLPGTIKQWVGTDAGWRNIGLPVSGGTAFSVGGSSGNYSSASTSYNASPDCMGSWGNYINTINVYTFNEGAQAHEWYGASAAPTGGTSGYNIYTGTPFGTSGVATIKGTFLDPTTVGSYSYSHTAPHVSPGGTGSQSNVVQGAGCIAEPVVDRQANWNGWALVANPFPCNLDVNQFAADNGFSTNQIRIWSRASNQYVEANHSTLGFTTIAPMQAFWIKLGTAGHAAPILFDDTHRVFDVANFLKYNGNQISLRAENTSTQEVSEIHLQFNSAATKQYDILYDSYSYSQPGTTAPQLAFHNTYLSNGAAVVAPLDYNTVPDVQSSDSYQLRFWSRSAGQFSFSVDPSTMLPAWNVYIEDKKMAPGVFENITSNNYTFNYDPSVDSPERFVMHFAPHESLSIDHDEKENKASDNVFAFVDERGIRVKFEDYPFKEATIIIYTLTGQQLYEQNNVSTAEVFLYENDKLASAMYLVNVIGEDGTKNTFRVFK